MKLKLRLTYDKFKFKKLFLKRQLTNTITKQKIVKKNCNKEINENKKNNLK